MTRTLAFLLLGFLATVAVADDETTPPLSALDAWQADHTVILDAADVTLDDFRWLARPVVVFADSPNDPRFQQQMELLAMRPNDLAERDIVLITDTDPSAETAIRTALRPRGFMMALLGKDGGVRLRKPLPWETRELSRVIDKMPMRQQEIEDRRASAISE